MTKQDRDKLRELALAATPGEWEMASDLPAYAIYTENGWRVVQTPNQNNRKQWGTSNDTHGIGRFSDAAYIAAANPATLLALLDRIDELERRDAQRGTINVDDLIIQRDYWEKIATALAERVGEHFGFEVGEHSNMNCPVLNALESKWTDPPTERAVPEWIPVSERLPDENEMVLVYTPGEEGGTDFDFIEDGGWSNHEYNYQDFIAAGGYSIGGDDFPVKGPSADAPYTHWMPLPAAPGAGGE